ncbi:uromodulin-like 1 [Stegastes partitus]|uniref:Uromodulin-like 1 n=1 Tax=Stegastes partitus TaxID=144197 RepID=A0A9Y4KA87_9TELE|nr:PREDICTED: uromodulin-like 1 [Stegastes partitus]
MSDNNGLLNHIRILQAMVTGALQSEVSIYYLNSWPVHPHRTATSLLIVCDFPPSLHNVTSKLHLLLKHIQEVSSVTVRDVDECAHAALRLCSLQAHCNNTVGSYQCVCHQGYADVDPSNPGANCTADVGESCITEPPLTSTTFSPAPNATQEPPGGGIAGVVNSSESSVTAALSNTTSVPYNSSYALPWTSSPPNSSVSSTEDSLLPTTTCPPPSISSLLAANVTGTSFSVCWTAQFQTNQTYKVVLSKGSEVILSREIWQTMTEVKELQPGILYDVSVTPCACGSEGVALRISVKTNAQTLDATARLTNIQFTADLQNASSQAYKNLTAAILAEIYQSLSPEMRHLVDSGQVQIEIRGFSPGSVVVNFTMTFATNQSQDVRNVSTALLHSLMNSSKYTVDENNTSISDFDECASGENDCSQWATCNNTWASYKCVCQDGFIDNNPERPGRACQAIATSETTTPILTTAAFSTASPVSQTTPSTSGAAVTTAVTPGTTTVIIPTSEMVSTSAQDTTTSTSTNVTSSPTKATTPPATTTIPQTTITSIPTTSSAPTSVHAPVTVSTAPTTTTSAPTTTTTPKTTTIAISMQGSLSVQCRVAAITVTIAKDFLLSAKIQESALYLGLRPCGVNGGNDTHVQLTVGWNECATVLVHNETYYTASVTLFNTMDPYTSRIGAVEAPTVLLKVPIMCTYMKSMLISADFGSMGYDMIKDVIVGLGSFQVTVQLMNGSVPLPHNYSLSPEQAVVVEVRLNTSSEQLKVVINKCWATPTQSPADAYSQAFLENSCSLNSYTKVLMNGNSSTSRVSVQIFSIVKLNVIYLHCQVQICIQIGSDTCVPDCLQRTARSAKTIGTAFGSFGPVLMSEEESVEEESSILHVVGLACLGVGLSIFFIVGFVCLFYYQRNRIGHYNFSVKPKQENFTYLVFNT